MKIPIEMPVGTIQILILLVFHSSSSPYSDGVCKYIAWNCENFACFSARSQLRMAPHLTNSSKKKKPYWLQHDLCIMDVWWEFFSYEFEILLTRVLPSGLLFYPWQELFLPITSTDSHIVVINTCFCLQFLNLC